MPETFDPSGEVLVQDSRGTPDRNSDSSIESLPIGETQDLALCRARCEVGEMSEEAPKRSSSGAAGDGGSGSGALTSARLGTDARRGSLNPADTRPQR
jgi:hypothetical protein